MSHPQRVLEPPIERQSAAGQGRSRGQLRHHRPPITAIDPSWQSCSAGQLLSHCTVSLYATGTGAKLPTLMLVLYYPFRPITLYLFCNFVPGAWEKKRSRPQFAVKQSGVGLAGSAAAGAGGGGGGGGQPPGAARSQRRRQPTSCPRRPIQSKQTPTARNLFLIVSPRPQLV